MCELIELNIYTWIPTLRFLVQEPETDTVIKKKNNIYKWWWPNWTDVCRRIQTNPYVSP